MTIGWICVTMSRCLDDYYIIKFRPIQASSMRDYVTGQYPDLLELIGLARVSLDL